MGETLLPGWLFLFWAIVGLLTLEFVEMLLFSPLSILTSTSFFSFFVFGSIAFVYSFWIVKFEGAGNTLVLSLVTNGGATITSEANRGRTTIASFIYLLIWFVMLYYLTVYALKSFDFSRIGSLTLVYSNVEGFSSGSERVRSTRSCRNNIEAVFIYKLNIKSNNNNLNIDYKPCVKDKRSGLRSLRIICQ